jgi:hypothetical protein
MLTTVGAQTMHVQPISERAAEQLVAQREATRKEAEAEKTASLTAIPALSTAIAEDGEKRVLFRRVHDQQGDESSPEAHKLQKLLITVRAE